MQALFETVPHATLPPRAQPPSRAQDLLEELRFIRQRLDALQRQQDAQIAHLFETELALKKALKVGQEVSVPGGHARRVRGGLDFTWAP